MRGWKITAIVVCLGVLLTVFSGMAEAKVNKDMVQEKTAYVTRCSYISTGSSTGGHERIEILGPSQHREGQDQNTNNLLHRLSWVSFQHVFPSGNRVLEG